jgi:diadenosine tetraphosphate (Ap4A) HIT family hydrolase
MVSGAECPICADAHLSTNDHSDLIVESTVSITRLSKIQTHTGYSIVILKRHASELHDLDKEELRIFWLDIVRVSRANC